MSDFYITLASNTRSGGNSITDFHVDLAETIDLGGQWSVALTELIYPVTFHTLQNAQIQLDILEYTVTPISDLDGSQAAIGIAQSLKIENHPVTGQPIVDSSEKLKKVHFLANLAVLEEETRQVLDITSNHYSTPAGLVKTINHAFFNFWEDKIKFIRAFMPIHNDEFQPTIDTIVDRIKQIQKGFKIEYEAATNRVLLIIPNQVKQLELPDQLIYMLGFTDWEFGPGEHVAMRPPDVKAGITTLFVYLPIIQPQLVGDSKVCLLKMVPIKGAYGDQTIAEFTQLEYLPVAVRRFSSIQVSIKGHDGGEIPFSFGTIYVKLHFRRKSLL